MLDIIFKTLIIKAIMNTSIRMSKRSADISKAQTAGWIIEYSIQCPFCGSTKEGDHHCKESNFLVFAIRDKEDENRKVAGLPLIQYCHDDERKARNINEH